MSNDPVDQVQASWIKKEPVLAAFLGAAVAGAAATFATAHFGTNQDTVKQVLEPVIEGGVLAALGFITRQFVMPMVKVAKVVEVNVQSALGNKPDAT